MPTAPGTGNATFIQLIPFSSPWALTGCSAMPISPSYTGTQGALTAAWDSSHMALACYNQTGANTVSRGSTMGETLIAQVMPSGVANIIYSATYAAVAQYETGGIAPFSMTNAYTSVIGGGSVSGIQFLVPNTGALTTVSVNTAGTPLRSALQRLIMPYKTPGGTSYLFVAVAGNATNTASPYTSFQGLAAFSSPPTSGATLNGWTQSQVRAGSEILCSFWRSEN